MNSENLLDLPLTEIAALLTRSFQGYIVDIRFEAAMVAGIVRTEAIDLAACRRAVVDGQDAGIALVARRGTVCRVAAMAVCPEARGKGVGRALMEQVIADARTRGEQTLTLEVIEQNPAAIGLYESLGMRRVRRLVGFSGAGPDDGGSCVGLYEEEIVEVAREVAAYAPGLPWQIAPETIAQLGMPNRAFRKGPAEAVISDPDQAVIAIRGLVVPPQDRLQGHGSRIVRAIQARFPGKSWRITPVVPEGMADGFFESVGLKRDELTQFQMELPL